MLLSFELSMPGVASWNGQWSGEGRLYAKVVGVRRAKAAQEQAAVILRRGSFGYSFGDGWRASVRVREVTPAEARTIRRHSQGFCGYDWMVVSILRDGEITP